MHYSSCNLMYCDTPASCNDALINNVIASFVPLIFRATCRFTKIRKQAAFQRKEGELCNVATPGERHKPEAWYTFVFFWVDQLNSCQIHNELRIWTLSRLRTRWVTIMVFTNSSTNCKVPNLVRKWIIQRAPSFWPFSDVIWSFTHINVGTSSRQSKKS